MLDRIDLTTYLSKEDYRREKDALGKQLTLLHRAAWEARLPVIVVVEGWDTAGKSGLITFLSQFLDPRGLKVHATRRPRKEERQMPWLWPFWLRIPAYGEMVFFDQSWYHRALSAWLKGDLADKRYRHALQDILDFERILADDGYLLIKIYLHIRKKEQEKRLEKLEDDPLQSWRVSRGDWRENKRYKKQRIAVEDLLAQTDSEWASWLPVAATDRRWSRVAVMRYIIQALSSRLETAGHLPAENLLRAEESEQSEAGRAQPD